MYYLGSLNVRSCRFQQIVVMAKLFETIGKVGLALAFGGGIVNSALFNGEFFSSFYLNKGFVVCCWTK